MIERSNCLQVTLLGRVIIYDLRGVRPTAMTELPAMQHLICVDSYVVSGCDVQKIKVKGTKGGDEPAYLLKR